jgi:hypothetical protein
VPAAARPVAGPAAGTGRSADAGVDVLGGAIWEESACQLLEDMLQLLGAAALTLSDGLIDR